MLKRKILATAVALAVASPGFAQEANTSSANSSSLSIGAGVNNGPLNSSVSALGGTSSSSATNLNSNVFDPYQGQDQSLSNSNTFNPANGQTQSNTFTPTNGQTQSTTFNPTNGQTQSTTFNPANGQAQHNRNNFNPTNSVRNNTTNNPNNSNSNTQTYDPYTGQNQDQSQGQQQGINQQDMSSGASLNLTQISNVPSHSKTEATIKQTPLPPGVLNTIPINPELYVSPTDTGPVKSLPLLIKYIQQCQPVFGQGVPSTLEQVKGASGLTKVTFWASPQAYTERRLVANGANWCDPNGQDQKACLQSQVDSGQWVPMKPSRVIPSFPTETNGICLGVMTVDSLEPNGSLVNLISDAVNYTLTNIEGYRTVYLVSIKDAVGYTLSVHSNGWGVGASPGVAAASSPSTLWTSVLGLGVNGGTTQYGLQPGNTFLLVGCDEGQIVSINLADLQVQTKSLNGQPGVKVSQEAVPSQVVEEKQPAGAMRR